MLPGPGPRPACSAETTVLGMINRFNRGKFLPQNLPGVVRTGIVNNNDLRLSGVDCTGFQDGRQIRAQKIGTVPIGDNDTDGSHEIRAGPALT